MDSLAICLVQAGLAWESPAVNLEHFDELTGSGTGADLIVLPEMFTTGFSMDSTRLAETMEGPTVTWMRDKAALTGATLCGSIIIEDGGRYFNRLVWMPADGDVRWYDKHHLFRMSGEHHHYSAGTTRPVFEIRGFRVCPQICYDLRFPVWSRNDSGFDLLIYVANWPSRRREHWKTLLRARAIENLCYVAAVNRVGEDGNRIDHAGDSVVHDCDGTTLLALGSVETVDTVTLRKGRLEEYRQDFPAHLDADPFQLT